MPYTHPMPHQRGIFMKTVSEVSRLTGVSVRTLHHYDAIGLLKPTAVSVSGYRLYDDGALMRLQTILLLKELQFPLREIKAILSAPGFDPMQALGEQIRLMELQRDRLNRLIILARQIQETGVISLDFTVFDKKQMDKHAAEAKARWGRTDAWKEYEQKTEGKSAEAMQNTGEQLMDIFRELGRFLQHAPESPEVQALIARLRAFITENYYTCTPQILRGLGQMYVSGGSMTENIDAAGGAGTAELARKAIEYYCDHQ